MAITRFTTKVPSLPSMIDRILNADLMDLQNMNFAGTDSSLPAVNVKEDDEQYILQVAAPGMKKEDFKINFDNGRLSISTEKKMEEVKEESNYIRKEFNYETFQRSFIVPENEIDTAKIHAKYIDGILNITLPKREEVKPKPSREINIS